MQLKRNIPETWDIIDNYDDAEQAETCSVCGKLIDEGTGRFRKIDTVYCVECHERLRKTFCELPHLRR